MAAKPKRTAARRRAVKRDLTCDQYGIHCHPLLYYNLPYGDRGNTFENLTVATSCASAADGIRKHPLSLQFPSVNSRRRWTSRNLLEYFFAHQRLRLGARFRIRHGA